MMRYAFLVVFVALALQASARHILSDDKAPYRPSIKDRIEKAFEQGEIGALRRRHADEGYPEFDGNIFKQLMAQMTSDVTIKILKKNDVEELSVLFPIIKPIIKSALKKNWKSFEEYVDFWGAAINVIVEEAKEVYKKITGEEYSYDSSKHDSSDFKSDLDSHLDFIKQWVSKLDDYFKHNNIDPDGAFFRNIIKNSEVDISDEFEVRTPWHGHADKGYPEFDGNPFKKLMSDFVDNMLRDGLAFFKALHAPSDVIAVFERAQEATWKNFDEYLEYWGEFLPALIEANVESKRREQLRQQQ